MRSLIFVFVLPSASEDPRCIDVHENISIEALGSEPSVERFDESVLIRFARFDEVKANFVACRPFLKRLRAKLRPIIHDQDLWFSVLHLEAFENANHVGAFDGFRSIEIWYRARSVIHHCKKFQLLVVGEAIVNEIHRPNALLLHSRR